MKNTWYLQKFRKKCAIFHCFRVQPPAFTVSSFRQLMVAMVRARHRRASHITTMIFRLRATNVFYPRTISSFSSYGLIQNGFKLSRNEFASNPRQFQLMVNPKFFRAQNVLHEFCPTIRVQQLRFVIFRL
jgi:hypothetical protein